MTLSRLLGVIVRWWYVLLIGLLVTVGLGYAAIIAVPPTYTAKGLVLLLPSTEVVGTGGNPLLSLEGLDQPANLVVSQLNSNEAREQVEAFAPKAEYTVAMDDSTRGPVVSIAATAPDPAVALSVQHYLASQIPATLDALQRQVEAPPKSLVTSMPLVMDQVAQARNTTTLRAVIAAVVAGLVLTMLATFALDGIMARSRGARGDKRRSETRPPATTRAAYTNQAAASPEGGSSTVSTR